jgi:hypothetical protein
MHLVRHEYFQRVRRTAFAFREVFVVEVLGGSLMVARVVAVSVIQAISKAFTKRKMTDFD